MPQGFVCSQARSLAMFTVLLAAAFGRGWSPCFFGLGWLGAVSRTMLVYGG